MIEINQQISDSDYKKAIAIHYFGYRYTYLNPIIGLIIFVSIIILMLNYPDKFDEIWGFLLFFSVYLITRPILYIQNVYRSNRSSKIHTKPINIQITDEDKIIIKIDENTSSFCIEDLYGYRNNKTFLFLYTARNQYLIIDKRQIENKQIEEIIRRLEKLNIRKK